MKRVFCFLCLFFLLFAGISVFGQTGLRFDSLKNARVEELKKLIPVFQKMDGQKAIDFANLYSETNSNNYYTINSGSFPAGSQPDFEKAEVGQVLGPYVDSNLIELFKVDWKGIVYDSAEVRHILISYSGAERAAPGLNRTYDEARLLADSLKNLVINGTVPMINLVAKYTDDYAGKKNKGNYGWFTWNSGFVNEFKQASFENPVGSVVVTESIFGFHLIQVLGQKGPRFSVKAILIKRIIDPDRTAAHFDGDTIHARFPGGMIQLYSYLQDSLRYPEFAKKYGIEGLVFIQFRIDTSGNVVDVQEIFKPRPARFYFSSEAVRLIKSMPAWTPAKCHGIPCDDLFELIVPFRLIN